MPGGRTLTVLVADVVESTRLNTGLGQDRADEVRRLIFRRFDDAVVAHGGTLIKTMGDGCLATFVAAADAVAAGLNMVDAIERLARQVIGLKLRVGVAVGDVTEESQDVFGHAVVVASRLCSAASPNQVLATDVVRVLATGRGRFDWEPVGELFLKGIEDAVSTSAARERHETTRLSLPHALRTRPGELFVGRLHEIDVLKDAWKESLTGQRRTVLVSGEPGVGKTRLVAGQARIADDAGALVLYARCEEDLAVPYQPFADALRVSMQNLPSDLLTAHVDACGGELRRLFPQLRTPHAETASPEIERLRLFDAVNDILGRLAGEQPIVLVFDDIQWAAPATLQLLKHIITLDEPTPLLLLATFRDTEVDRRHPLSDLLGDVSGADGVSRISLAGLNEHEMEWLVEQTSGDELDADGLNLARALHARTSGNPFFAGQVLRHWAEAGALVHGAEGWEARTGALEVPDGVLDVVRRRLSRLSDETNAVLSLAAVAGLSFTHGVLARAAGGDDVESPLKSAVRARLLTDNGRGGYAFVHAIVRDALLAELTTTERARRHRAVGLALLDVHGDRMGVHLHDLAYHFSEAALLGDVDNVSKFALLAAEECIRRTDVVGALVVLERAWHAIDGVEPINHERRFDICNRLSELHYRRVDGIFNSLQAAAESARILHDPERLVTLAYSAYRFDIGVDDPYPLRIVEDAIAWLPNEPSEWRAGAYAAMAYLQNMQSTGASAAWTTKAFDELAILGEPRSVVAELARRHAAVAEIGQPGAARQLERMATFDARAVPIEGFYAAIFWSVRAELCVRLGDRVACDAALDALDKELSHTGEPTASIYSRTWVVVRAFFEGRFADAPPLFTGALPTVGVAVANAASVLAVWTMWLAYEEGRSAEIIDGLRLIAAATGQAPAMVSPLAVHLCEIGLFDEAREHVVELVANLPTTGRNATFGTIIALTATAAGWIGDAEFAPPLLDELDPFSGEIIILPSCVVLGAADSYRGRLLSLLDRHDEAVAAMASAIEVEARFGALPSLARSRYWLARVLLARGDADDEARARDQLTLCLDEATALGMAGVVRAAQELLA